MTLLPRLVLAASLLLAAAPAHGQYTRDAAASAKIDEALNQHYLASNFGKAEEVLLGTIKACQDKCSPGLLARAWMYVGVVRGSGKQDQTRAREAFLKALDLDPAVALDAELSTPETRATFEAAKSEPRSAPAAPPVPPAPAAPPTPAPTTPVPPPAAPATETLPVAAPPVAPLPAPVAAPTATPAGLRCTPAASRVETRRPIPVDCAADAETTGMSLRYQPFGSTDWITLRMVRAGTSFQAQIPCQATENTGPLKYFVLATDAAGVPVDTFGNKNSPVHLDLVSEVQPSAPAFPGQPPPARCAGKGELCPPNFPGCQGKPRPAPEPPVATHPRHFVGLHFGADFGFMGGKDPCRVENPGHECYFADTEDLYPAPLPEMVADRQGEVGNAYPGAGIRDGVVLGTFRLLGSYAYALTPSFTAGARLGLAFRGGPSPDGMPGFFPLHAEARLRHFLAGPDALHRPYFALGGGFAQFDFKTRIDAKDCSAEVNHESFERCVAASGEYDSANQPELPLIELDVYRRLGRAFVGGGFGVLFTLAPHVGLEAEIVALYTAPDNGLVVEPSLGAVYFF